MLGLGLQLNKMVNRAGGLPPLASLLTFFSKQRDDTTVINKLDSSGDSDAYLTVDPEINIIDLSKYDIEDGTGDDLGWKIVKFNTINGEKTYKVISTPTTYIENGNTYNGLNEVRNDLDGNYILSEDIDLIDTATQNPTTSSGDYDAETTYALDTVVTYDGNRYRSLVNDNAGNTPDTNPDSWKLYNYMGWTPIGIFTGVFNGNGFKISNLFIDRPLVAITVYTGLFLNCIGAKISNIGIVDCNVTGVDRVGGLVGFNTSSSTITNSYATGSVTGNSYVGGLVGYNASSSTINNCYSIVIVNNDETPTQSYVSAFCGRNLSTIDSCFCINHDNLSFSQQGTIINSGEKTELQLKDILTYTTAPVDWDFTTIWNIDPTGTINNGYPYLRNLDSSGNTDAYLTVDPTIDIIDLEKYKPYTVVDGWNTVTFKTIDGDKVYRVISTFDTVEGIKGLNNIRLNDDLLANYILDFNIDMSPEANNGAVDWNVVDTYAIGDIVKYSDNKYYTSILESTAELPTNTTYWALYTGWNSINSFTGVFNGNGFKIDNLYINKPTVNYIGLFSSSTSLTISNTNLSSINIEGRSYIGGMVGGSTVDTNNVRIYNCKVSGSILGNDRYVGGIMGYAKGCTIENCISDCSITATGGIYSGGIAGLVYESTMIKNSYFNGVITGFSGYFGGVGYFVSPAAPVDSYFQDYDGYAGNDIGKKDDLTSNTDGKYDNWNFDNIWVISSSINDGYPYLRNLEEGYVSPYGALTKIVTVNITETDPDEPHSYVKMPDSIKIGGLSLFNKDDPVIYDTTVSTTAEEYVSEDPYLWHVDELNTERILSYLKDAYKFTWFVKNTFTEGTYEPLTIKEIFAYSQKIEDADNLSKIMKYLKINVWYDSQIWDDDAEWID